MSPVLVLTLLSSILGLTAASPTPFSLASRSCTTITPSTIDVLKASSPDSASLGMEFTLNRTGNPTEDTVLSALTFSVPEGSTGCVLKLLIPALATDNQIAGGDATDAEFYETEPWNETYAPTWNKMPEKKEMKGTYQFPTKKTDAPVEQTIESDVCETTMSFLVDLKDSQQGMGSVDFQTSNELGFEMVYNC